MAAPYPMKAKDLLEILQRLDAFHLELPVIVQSTVTEVIIYDDDFTEDQKVEADVAIAHCFVDGKAINLIAESPL